MLYVYWVENDDLKQGGKQLIGSNFVILCVYWVENDDLKTTAWREQDLNGTDIIHKKCG